MARTSTSLCRSIAALSKGAFRTSSLRAGYAPCASAPALLPPNLRNASSRISRLRGAIISLQPLHEATSQGLFVSRLSFGTQEPIFLIQGLFSEDNIDAWNAVAHGCIMKA